MTADFARFERLRALDGEAHRGELLSALQQYYDETEAMAAPARSDYFPTMFEWTMLAASHPPAAEALARARDEQVRRLLAGEHYTGSDQDDGDGRDMFQRVLRISLIVEMNETLDDPHATHALFLQIAARQPELARRYAWRALPAIVAAGDFALADRYRGDPLALLDDVNATAAHAALFPAGRQAPRLAADLMNLTREARIGIAVLHGLGRPAEAQALRAALLDGLASEELRSLAARELETPGTISTEVGRHQAAAWETPD